MFSKYVTTKQIVIGTKSYFENEMGNVEYVKKEIANKIKEINAESAQLECNYQEIIDQKSKESYQEFNPLANNFRTGRLNRKYAYGRNICIIKDEIDTLMYKKGKLIKQLQLQEIRPYQGESFYRQKYRRDIQNFNDFRNEMPEYSIVEQQEIVQLNLETCNDYLTVLSHQYDAYPSMENHNEWNFYKNILNNWKNISETIFKKIRAA